MTTNGEYLTAYGQGAAKREISWDHTGNPYRGRDKVLSDAWDKGWSDVNDERIAILNPPKVK